MRIAGLTILILWAVIGLAAVAFAPFIHKLVGLLNFFAALSLLKEAK